MGTGVACMCGGRRTTSWVSSRLLQRVPWTQVVTGRISMPAFHLQCNAPLLAVSREPRVLLGYTRLHVHLEGRKVVLKHPSKSLTFYEFRTFLEKNQRLGIFQPFEPRLWVIKSHLGSVPTDTWRLCSFIWWENIHLGNKCKVGGGKWLHKVVMISTHMLWHTNADTHTYHACVCTNNKVQQSK